MVVAIPVGPVGLSCGGGHGQAWGGEMGPLVAMDGARDDGGGQSVDAGPRAARGALVVVARIDLDCLWINQTIKEACTDVANAMDTERAWTRAHLA